LSPLMLSVPQRRSAMASWAAASIELKTIAFTLQCSIQTVRRWVERDEATGNLRDGTRQGHPTVYGEEEKLRIIAFYCQTRLTAAGGKWSLRLAARQLQVAPAAVGVSPSKSTIQRILKSNGLKPHVSRYFLHITDPDFFPKMEHLIALYRNPPRNLFFFDECPGIQVLSRLVPDLQTEATRKRLEEFEYIRNGTLDVFAFLNNADGKVCVECHADHTTETFLDVFRRHVELSAPDEPLHYVMDNLSTHVGYPFCQLVAQLRGVRCPPERKLCTIQKRAEWLGKKGARIVIHYTPYHGSWLNSVEIWFGIMGAKNLHGSYSSPEQLKAASLAFADLWNQLLAHPFRWTYDGKGLHEKAVKRFVKMLTDCPEKLDVKTLTKLLTLMTNLLRDYFLSVSEKSWHQLATSLSSQCNAVCALIEQEKGPKRQKRASEALGILTTALHERSLLPSRLAA
jgi:transposase